jgi:transposase InsO family protein
LAFNLAIDKDVVRRILAHHHWPGQSPGGPCWLTFLGHMKKSLWSKDRFRCESVTLRTHWVLVVMDQYTRRIIGFGVHAGTVDRVALCRMFHRAIRGQHWLPKYLASCEYAGLRGQKLGMKSFALEFFSSSSQRVS